MTASVENEKAENGNTEAGYPDQMTMKDVVIEKKQEEIHPLQEGEIHPMALKSLPLLKFDGKGKPKINEESLAAIMRLPGPILPIAFVGDGRSGKSFLATRLAEVDDAFPQDDSDVAVTEGIDAMIVPYHPGHMVIMDCEGGNNAMSKSHSIVTVVGALLATNLIFVTDGKASEAAIEALSMMLQERALIRCDGTGSLAAQTLLFVVNQNRLRYQDDTLEKILDAKHDEERVELRDLISKAYPADRRFFYTVPGDHKKDFEEKWNKLRDGIHNTMRPLKMGKLWMTGAQMGQMLIKVESELRTRGKVSLPSLHRHVILDTWLKPTVGQVLSSRLDKLLEESKLEHLLTHQVGTIEDTCTDCKKEKVKGWCDPDTDDFYCEECWTKFSPKVLKCGFCNNFQPWPCGRVEVATKLWHCIDCLMQLGIEID
jgi:hypothetical protein